MADARGSDAGLLPLRLLNDLGVSPSLTLQTILSQFPQSNGPERTRALKLVEGLLQECSETDVKQIFQKLFVDIIQPLLWNEPVAQTAEDRHLCIKLLGKHGAMNYEIVDNVLYVLDEFALLYPSTAGDRFGLGQSENVLDQTQKPVHPSASATFVELLVAFLDQPSLIQKNYQMLSQRIFVTATHLLSCSLSVARRCVINLLLPKLFALDAEIDSMTHRSEWIQLIWQTSLDLYNTGQGEFWQDTYGILTRFLPVAMMSDVSGVHQKAFQGMDLRLQPQFFQIIQSGLMSGDALATKRSSFLLHCVIQISQNKQLAVNKDLAEKQWLRVFYWDFARTRELNSLWDGFFLLFDTLDETSVHLIEPLLGELDRLMTPLTGLDQTWWALLLQKAFKHEHTIRKFMIHRVLESEDRVFLERIAKASWHDVIGPLLESCDDPSLYKTGFSTVSHFGDLIVSFLHRVHQLQKSTDQQIAFVRQLASVALTSSYHVGLLLHIFRFLSELPSSIKYFGREELALFPVITHKRVSERSGSRLRLARWYLFLAAIERTDFDACSYADLATFFTFCFDEELFEPPDGLLWSATTKWINNEIIKSKGDNFLVENVLADLERVLEMDPDDDESVLVAADRIGQLTLLVSAQSLSLAHQIISRLMQEVHTWPVQPHPHANMALWLLPIVLKNVRGINNLVEVDAMMQISSLPSLLTQLETQIFDSAQETDFHRFRHTLKRLIGFFEGYILIEKQLRTQSMLLDFAVRIADRSRDILVGIQADEANSNEPARRRHQMTKVVATAMLSISMQLIDLHSDTIPASQRDHYIISMIQTLLGTKVVRPQDILCENNHWKFLVQRFQPDKWRCLSILLKAYLASPLRNHELIVVVWSSAVAMLPQCPASEAAAMLVCLNTLVDHALLQNILSPDQLYEGFDAMWSLVVETLNEWQLCVDTVRLIAQVTFSPVVMCHPGIHAQHSPVKLILDRLIKEGESHVGILMPAAKQLFEFWRHDIELTHFECYLDQITELLLFGPPRILNRTYLRTAEILEKEMATVANAGQQHAQQQASLMEKDTIVRAYMCSLLAHLDQHSPRHVTCAWTLLRHLLQYDLLDPKIKYYENTPEHRRKMRQWQAILLLIPFVDSSEKATVVVNEIFALMITRESFMSVRYLMEFCIIRLVLAFPAIAASSFLVHLQDYNERAAVMCSMSSMTLHIARHLSRQQQDQATFIQQAVPLLIPWCCCNHYNVRLLAAMATLKICEIAQGISTASREMEAVVASFPQAAFLRENLEYSKHRANVEKEYFFEMFNPHSNYSWQFLFHDILEITNMTLDDAIGADIFEIIDASPPSFIGTSTNTPAGASSISSRLRGHYKEDVQNVRPKLTAAPVAEHTALPSLDKTDPSNFQRKIQPWELLLQSELELTRSNVESRSRHELIVIASLIDKLPNLGGICRTCEIFNASKLVVDDIKVRDLAAFKNVSVTAENWLPMEEVKAGQLGGYLRLLQSRGYEILGVEQTANSRSLAHFNFKNKTALVLGKEKEGIPVDLIQMLDACIEIPQFGLVRSLNVHVSGAILVWEYTRQRVISS